MRKPFSKVQKTETIAFYLEKLGCQRSGVIPYRDSRSMKKCCFWLWCFFLFLICSSWDPSNVIHIFLATCTVQTAKMLAVETPVGSRPDVTACLANAHAIRLDQAHWVENNMAAADGKFWTKRQTFPNLRKRHTNLQMFCSLKLKLNQYIYFDVLI